MESDIFPLSSKKLFFLEGEKKIFSNQFSMSLFAEARLAEKENFERVIEKSEKYIRRIKKKCFRWDMLNMRANIENVSKTFLKSRLDLKTKFCSVKKLFES